MSTIKTPTVRVEWSLWKEEMPVVTRKVNGRTLTVRPRELRVSSSRTDLSDLSVYIEGTTIKANGSDGQHRRGHGFHAKPYFAGEATLEDLPAWARPYLDRARAILAAESTGEENR
jgi:hypothetical protein